MRYNVIGSVVNECSRIESFSVGGQILASQEALKYVRAPLELSTQQDIQAKGLQRPITVCEVTGILGDYNCRLCGVQNDILHPVKEWVLFNLYPIEGKLIQDVCVAGRLLEFSYKRAVVMLEEEESYELSPLTDVEIFAAGEKGKALFTETYAKITERDGRRVILRFTHVNRSFQTFIKSLED